jgi:RNAse (barnase) inhibitor barstar
MREISINCAGLEDEASLYALFAKSLDFTGRAGDGAEALYDCLTAIDQETRLTIFGLEELPFGEAVRNILLDAETDNFWLSISL